MEHTLHGITLFSVVIAALGFLFFSYGIFDRPHGILRWLIQVIVPGLIFALPWSILAFFLPASLLLGPFSIQDIASKFAFYGGLIGFFNGLFAGTPDKEVPAQVGKMHGDALPQQLPLPSTLNAVSKDLAHLVAKREDRVQQSQLDLGGSSVLRQKLVALWKRLSWIWNTFLKDAVTGFIFASAFWFVETFLILGLPFYAFTPDYLVRDYAGFATVGLVGGSLWRFIHQPARRAADGLPPFSLKYFLAGLVVWMMIYLLVGLLSVPVFVFLWHTTFVVPFAVLPELLLIALMGALASGFTGFIQNKISRSSSLFPREASYPALIIPEREGIPQSSERQRENRVASGSLFTTFRKVGLDIALWLLTWSIIGLAIFLFGSPVITMLTDKKISIETFDSYAYMILFGQRFIASVLLGTAFTLLAGSCAALLVQVMFRRTIQALRGTISKKTLLSLSRSSAPTGRSTRGSGQTNRSLLNRFLSSLLKGVIALAQWYELWFVFPVVLLLHFLFKDWGLPVIVIVGVTAPAFGGGLLRFFLLRERQKKHAGPSDPLAFSVTRATMMKPIFWPLLWLAIWVTVTAALLSQDTQTISNFLNDAFGQIPFNAGRIAELLSQSLFVEEQHTILIGSAITVVAGGLVVLLWSAIFWCLRRLRASFVGKYAFQNALRYGIRARIHAFVLRSLENDPDRPYIFSLRESLLRLAYWTGTWFISGTITFIGFAIITNVAQGLGPGFGFDFSFFLYGLLGVIAIALASALKGGFSNAILLWATRLPRKRLGALGVVLTIGGFLLQLIEPTVLLAYQPPTFGHTGAVLAVAWSPDGRHIASASAGSTVQVWAIGQEGNVLTYRGHYNGVETLAWSPDSKYIVSGSTDGTLQLWNATSGRTVSTGGVGTGTFTVAWSPHGNRIAASSPDGMVLLWTTAKKDGGNTVVNLAGTA